MTLQAFYAVKNADKEGFSALFFFALDTVGVRGIRV